MRHSDFRIGEVFWCSGRQWRCTDIGTRTVLAIRLDGVSVGISAPERRRTLGQAEAEAEGWFNGPPYAVAEHVFDEDDLPACSLQPDTDAASAPAAAADKPPESAGRTQANALREQARAGGLRFDAYLPPGLAEWLLDLIARGVFTDPSEAVFVMLGEQQQFEPHTDVRRDLFRRRIKEALDDPRPGIPHEVAAAEIEALLAAPRSRPALWRRHRR